MSRFKEEVSKCTEWLQFCSVVNRPIYHPLKSVWVSVTHVDSYSAKVWGQVSYSTLVLMHSTNSSVSKAAQDSLPPQLSIAVVVVDKSPLNFWESCVYVHINKPVWAFFKQNLLGLHPSGQQHNKPMIGLLWFGENVDSETGLTTQYVTPSITPTMESTDQIILYLRRGVLQIINIYMYFFDLRLKFLTYLISFSYIAVARLKWK